MYLFCMYMCIPLKCLHICPVKYLQWNTSNKMHFFCCSVAKSCPALCDPMDYSMPCFPVLHAMLPCPSLSMSFLRFVSIESVMPCNHLILFCPLLLLFSIFPSHQGLFPVSQLFTSCGQTVGASASASVLPLNIQGWFLLGLTDVIFVQSKGLHFTSLIPKMLIFTIFFFFDRK